MRLAYDTCPFSMILAWQFYGTPNVPLLPFNSTACPGPLRTISPMLDDLVTAWGCA
jgi:hypothetical protein